MTAIGFLFLVLAAFFGVNDSRASQNTSFVLFFAGSILFLMGITAFLWKAMP